MTENTDMDWFDHDINIVKKILKDRNLSEDYVDILIDKVVQHFEESSLDELTGPIVKYSLINDLGKKVSSDVANYFEQMKLTGSYETEIQKWAKKRGYDKD